MGGFDDLKSKITYENKTIFGVVGIIIGFLFWGIGHPAIGIGDVLILIFPAILLIIPNETIKNSKALSIIGIIILTIFLLVELNSLIITLTQYVPDSWAFPAGYVSAMLLADILQLILCIYGLFCAVLLLIPTKPNKTDVVPSDNFSPNINGRKYDKYCSKCGQGLFNDTKFCPNCGVKLK